MSHQHLPSWRFHGGFIGGLAIFVAVSALAQSPPASIRLPESISGKVQTPDGGCNRLSALSCQDCLPWQQVLEWLG